MSAPAWLNEHHSFPGGENGAFNPSADPATAYMPTPPSNNFEYNSLQQQQQQQQQQQIQQARQIQAQQQQHLQNGTVRHDSPAFHNPVYNTNQVIPSKRPRPREDSLATSPRQAPGGLPTSRSQTPQSGAYPGYQGTINGAQGFQPGAQYPQMQNVNGNAAPSPMLQDQGFNPSMAPPRVQNTSPAMFSPTPQNFGSQPSPVHSEHASRNGTPQNGAPGYGQGGNFPGTPTQPFNQPMNSPMNHNGKGVGMMTQYNQMPPNMSQQQQQETMEAIRRQGMMRQMQANSMQNRRFPGQPMHAANPMQVYQQQMVARQQQQQQGQQAAMRSNQADAFVRNVHQIMQQRSLPFNPHLTVLGRAIPPHALFMAVMTMGSSKRLSASQGWEALAQRMGFAPQQSPQAGHELQMYYQSNLIHYEAYYIQQKQRQQAMAQSQQVRGGNIPNGVPSQMAAQFSPAKQPLMNHQMASNQPAPLQQASIIKGSSAARQQNGFASPQQHPPHLRQQLPTNALQPNLKTKTTQQRPSHLSQQDQAAGEMSGRPDVSPSSVTSKRDDGYERMPLPINPPLSPNYKPTVKLPALMKPVVHNGMRTDLEEDDHLWGKVTDLLRDRPSVPQWSELGSINLRAVSLSLRSGIPGEIKVALDTLLIVSNAQMHEPLQLELCEDLLEVLIECAEDQIDLLTDNAPEISDAVLIPNYEDVIRSARMELLDPQEILEPGSLAYDLDRAVKRLLCITTLLRNLSFDATAEERPSRLSEPFVIKFLASAIRYLGTRNMLLRTHQATADFSKDIVWFLSNMSHKIDLSSREEASCILSFLLSFAPCPSPYTAPILLSSTIDATESPTQLCFSRYVSKIHRYYPRAIDCFAKLLAKDNPNRTLYRSLFAFESTSSSPPNDLFTRAFGLCVAGLPDMLNPKANTYINERAPFVAQGLIAAEILASLIPSVTSPSNGTSSSEDANITNSNLAASLLSSTDAWAPSLSRLVASKGIHYSGAKVQSTPLPDVATGNHGPLRRLQRDELSEISTSMLIAEHGWGLLRKLVEKAKAWGGVDEVVLEGLRPRGHQVLAALEGKMDLGLPEMDRDLWGGILALDMMSL